MLDAEGQKLKKILLTSGLDHGMVPGQSRFIDHKCPVNQCSITDRLEDAATADVILFKDYVNQPGAHRPSKQIWVLFMLESPLHTANFGGLGSVVGIIYIKAREISSYPRLSHLIYHITEGHEELNWCICRSSWHIWCRRI